MQKVFTAMFVLTGFALFAAVPLHAQTGFNQPWEDFPTKNISRETGAATVTVKYDTDLELNLSRVEPSTSVQVDPNCTVTCTVFFKEFPGKKGKPVIGLDLGPVNRNCFGCQIVVVLEIVSGNLEPTAQQLVVDQLVKLIHQGDRKKLGEQCFGPDGEPLPRFDVAKPTVPAKTFVKVSPTLWVFADTPRFCAFNLNPVTGFQLGIQPTTPPEKGTLFPGDELLINREFITYFNGECGTTTTTIASLAEDPLMFYVRWCCAHKVVAAPLLEGWRGESVQCKPSPHCFAALPVPLQPKLAKDFAAAQNALGAANPREAYKFSLGEGGTVNPLPECPKK